MLTHLEQLYAFYGEHAGLRVARKHLGWYRDHALPAHRHIDRTGALRDAEGLLFSAMRVATTAAEQQRLVREWFTAIGMDPSVVQGQQEPESVLGAA
jgi:tRNA-dihydrouridine synthase B